MKCHLKVHAKGVRHEWEVVAHAWYPGDIDLQGKRSSCIAT